MDMDNANYCLWLMKAPCRPLDWWSSAASWAQAILSVAAIYAAARLATTQERRAIRRKTQVYVHLIEMAHNCRAPQRLVGTTVLDAILGENPHLQELRQIAQALRSVTLEDLPDYRLLPILQSTAQSCESIVKILENVDPHLASSQDLLRISKTHIEYKMIGSNLEKARAVSEGYIGQPWIKTILRSIGRRTYRPNE